MKGLFKAAMCVTVVMTASPSFAWNDLGHMTVAATAWSRMSDQAKSRATTLLKLNPKYDRWVANIPQADRDRVAFIRAATWADHIKSDECQEPPRTPTPGCYADSGYRPADAGARLNIGYADRDLRRYWHFKNVPYSTDSTAVSPPFEFNAETQITHFLASLSNPQIGAEARSFNLTWLLHLVGDVHQPLHAVARFTQDDRNGDSGGNDVKLCPPEKRSACSEREQRTFHSYWDGALGGGRDPQVAIAKAASYANFQPNVAELNAQPAVWIEESVEVAKRWAYVWPIGPAKGPYYITADSKYARNAGSIAEQRVRLAGARLAEQLNRNLQ